MQKRPYLSEWADSLQGLSGGMERVLRLRNVAKEGRKLDENPMKKTYAEKLRDPRWQKRRLERLKASDFSCLNCEATDKELHVHHLIYERGKDPWDYEDKLLIPLCLDCHEAIDMVQKDIMRIMAEFPPEFLGELHMALCDLFSAGHQGKHIFERWSDWIKAARPKPRGKKRKSKG